MASNPEPVSDIDEVAVAADVLKMDLVLQYAELKKCMDKTAAALDELGTKIGALVGEDAMAVAVSPKRPPRASPVAPGAPRKRRARPLLEMAAAPAL